MFESLYAQVLDLWPESITLSKKEVFSEVSADFPDLWQVYDKIEAEVLENNSVFQDELLEISWAFYTLLHESAFSQQVLLLNSLTPDKVWSQLSGR